MRYFKQDTKGYWYPTTSGEILGVVPTSVDRLIAYKFKRFNEIFSNYVEGDSVNIAHVGKSTFFVHSKLESENNLPKGTYVIDRDMDWETVLKPLQIDYSQFVPLLETQAIINDIELFFNNRDKYDQLGIRHRRAYLLYGSPGNGKTTTIHQVIKDFDGYVFFIASAVKELEGLVSLRDALSGEKVIFVLEELTQMVEQEQLLSFLDGELSWSNCYVIATTNYPEELADNIVQRPSRFAKLQELGNPNYEARRTYFLAMGLDVTEQLLNETEGFSVDYLKEIVIKCAINNQEPLAAINDIVKMQKVVKQHFKTNKGNGMIFGK